MMKNWKFYLAGALVGIMGGFLFYTFWGCERGCTITGSPINASLYGMVRGALIGGSASDFFPKNGSKEDPEEPKS